MTHLKNAQAHLLSLKTSLELVLNVRVTRIYLT